MRRLRNHTTAVVLCTDVTALPNPPVAGTVAVVPASWSSAGRIAPEFDLDVWVTDADTEVTVAKLIGAIPHMLVVADDDVDTVDFANNELDIAAHGLQTGDGPLQLTTSDTIPTGLALLTDYYVIRTNAGTIQLATTLALALAGTAVAFSDVGAGTHTIEDQAATNRLGWHTIGWLGDSVDGSFSLTLAGKSYSTRAKHRARVVAYGLEATLDAANDINAEIVPVEEN